MNDYLETYVFPNKVITANIKDEVKKFPVGKIYCVGRNYIEHSIEMGESEHEEPFFFMKPPQSLTQEKEIIIPNDTSDLQHEVELVVFIGKECRDIVPNDAHQYIHGYSVGIDLTKRDLQKEAKEKGRPWNFSKGFDKSAPISLINKKNTNIIQKGKIELIKNNIVVQSADISDMIWTVDLIISLLSKKIVLYQGDVIFTGTPSGVSTINEGDEIIASIEDVGMLEIKFLKN